MPKRPSARVSRLWSASAAMPSSASRPQTGSAAASVKPPVKTPSSREQPLGVRRRAGRSSSRSRRAASAGAAGRRAGRAEQIEPAREPVEDLLGGEDLDAGGGELDRQRQPVEAAADLGDMRSRRRRRRGSTARARRWNRATAGSAASGPSASSCSAASCSGARLVTTSFERGDAGRIALRAFAASSSCSKLSTTISSSRPAVSPTACSSSAATSAGSSSAASVTKRAPSANRSPSRCASSSAKRVLPIPPGPVSVSSRTSGVGEQRLRGRQILVAAEQRRRRAAAAAAAGPASAADERGRAVDVVALRDGSWARICGLEPLQLGARVQAEVLDERVAGAAVGVERVGLAAGAVEGEHQLGVEALAVRVLGGQAFELGDELACRGRARGRARRAARARPGGRSQAVGLAAGGP